MTESRPTRSNSSEKSNTGPDAEVRPEIIDTDVHERGSEGGHHLVPYLAPQWQKYFTQFGWSPENYNPFGIPSVAGLYRADAVDEETGLGGTDLGQMQKDLFDDAGVDMAVLTGAMNASSLSPSWSEFKTAMTSAYNDWEIDAWLDRDPRLFGSIHVNAHDVEGAVAEIHRLGEHPKMVQIMMYQGDVAFGEPPYHPIYEAAQRYDLTVGFHPGSNMSSALGFGRYYIEWKSLVYQPFQAELASFIFQGVFDKFPNLRVGLIEGGFTWVPSFMWRLDQQYRGLKSEVPWVKRMPSDHIRDHVKFSTQPMEELTAAQLLQTIEYMGSDELLCFSTDYPHFDFDAPDQAFPADLPHDIKAKILSANARSLYPKLPARE